MDVGPQLVGLTPSAAASCVRDVADLRRVLEAAPSRSARLGRVEDRAHDLRARCSRAGRGRSRRGRARRGSSPASSRHQRAASAGKPAQCLTRLSRSSSTAATSSPSTTSAAAASPWKAFRPRIAVTAAILLTRTRLTGRVARLPRFRWLTVLVFAAAAFAFAYPMQVNAWNQNAHYALVRALADGTPTIDKSRHEIGDLGTGDVTLVDGHYYSNKAPGLALLTLPAFAVVDATGMRTTGDPTKVIWVLHLWAIVVPALLLVALVRYVGDRLEPGYGLAAAATLAFGTLVLPFSTMYFAHVVAGAFAFGAFALLVHERRGPPRLWLVGLAGLLGGYAATTEYTAGLAAVVIGVYALARHEPAPPWARVRRGPAARPAPARALQPVGLRLADAPVVRGEPGRARERDLRRRRAEPVGALRPPLLGLGAGHDDAGPRARRGRCGRAAPAASAGGARPARGARGGALARHVAAVLAVRRARPAAVPDLHAPLRRGRPRRGVPALSGDDRRARRGVDLPDDRDDGDEPARRVRPRLARPAVAPRGLPGGVVRRRRDRLVRDPAALRRRRRRVDRGVGLAAARAARDRSTSSSQPAPSVRGRSSRSWPRLRTTARPWGSRPSCRRPSSERSPRSPSRSWDDQAARALRDPRRPMPINGIPKRAS